MKTFKIERHENGLFYVNGPVDKDKFTVVDAESYDKLLTDHERSLDLLKILLKSAHLENFIKVE